MAELSGGEKALRKATALPHEQTSECQDPTLDPCPHQTLLTNHPPGHILAALEHLAAEREAEIRSLCSPDGFQDPEMARCGVDAPSQGRAGGWVSWDRGPRHSDLLMGAELKPSDQVWQVG